MLVCEAAGYDVVIVETVGVGQSETAVGCGRSGRLAVARRQGEVACRQLRVGDQVNDAHAQLLSNGNGW